MRQLKKSRLHALVKNRDSKSSALSFGYSSAVLDRTTLFSMKHVGQQLIFPQALQTLISRNKNDQNVYNDRRNMA